MKGYQYFKFLSYVLVFSVLQQTVYAQTETKLTVTSNPSSSKKEYVVLVHGLMRTSWSMVFLRNYLQKQGYETDLYGYPSTKYTIHKHALRFTDYLHELIKQHPDTKLHVVTFSLGGIIAREAITRLHKNEQKTIASLVMLAPPNQGSKYAKVVMGLIPVLPHFVKPLAELSSDQSSYVHKVPIPKVRIGIIAGSNDAKVPPASAELQGQSEFRVVNSTHTFIVNNSEARKLVLAFLKNGTFAGS